MFVRSFVRSFVRVLLAHFLRRVVIYSLWISVMYVLDNVLAAFLAPSDGGIVCGNR